MPPHTLPRRPLGRTGRTVSVLGLGAGALGRDDLDERAAEHLLHAALDQGIDFIDTARSYGRAEERIGRYLAHRRQEFVLSTKGGYGAEGIPDWTGACITAGIEAALVRLRTERIDIFHLHSCPLEVLTRDDILGALAQAVRAGKIAMAGYSGDNEPLDWAIRSGHFGAVECSLNLCDQRVLGGTLAAAEERGLGAIIKRPLANAPWRFAERPGADDVAVYWERLRALALDPAGLDWDALALRFAAFTPGVSTCIVGTASLEHLRRNASLLGQGPLPAGLIEQVRAAFGRHGADWRGLI
ncbi:MAG TPA: aldo/keto reductase [Polyangia bacterium]|jgi:aryl-alcohol dehydrogenase-like predicted oxidoreductase|nr:aldo/keto reductase [Polyangia bacterium]